MRIAHTTNELRNLIRGFRFTHPPDQTVGFVPTMGFLHEGHLSLIRLAREENQYVVVSIFVNPTQFGPGEDFAQYPRDESRDVALCSQAGVNVVFLPSISDMYPDHPMVTVMVQEITGVLCGEFRPGHFDGVATVVTKLFNMVQPDFAYFGQKDAQQALVIDRMTRELGWPLQIRVCPTVREPDGLAMSSRNVRLTPAGRQVAPLIYRGLTEARRLVEAGETRVYRLVAAAREIISADPGMTIQYLECRDREFLASLTVLDRPAVLAIAAYVDSVRLIDNVFLEPVTRSLDDRMEG
ncbi:pantoate--beta-alanine ligase [bacterium]|nr:pantoate--beta-alanine ligase [candidate division CSSED10-310 bacterium]